MSLSTTQSNYFSTSRTHSTTEFTIMTWAYVNSIASNYSTFYGFDASGNPSLGTSGGGDKFALLNNSTDAEGTTILSAGNWYHVCWYNTGGNDFLEVDGVDQGVSNVTSGGSASNTYIGRFAGGGFNVGEIYLDAIKIWDTVALSPSERAIERYSIKPVRWLDLFTWLPCNNGSALNEDWAGLGDWTVTGTVGENLPVPIAWGDSPIFIPELGEPPSIQYSSPLMLLLC